MSLINAKTLSFIDTYLKFGDFPSETKVVSVYKTNQLFVATDVGIAISKPALQNASDPASWTTFANSINISAGTVYKITKFNSSVVAATDKGLFTYADNNWNQTAYENTPLIDAFAANNKLYVLQNHEINEFDGSNNNTLYQNSSVQFASITVSGNKIYGASDKGVIELDGSKIRTVFPDGPKGNAFSNIMIDADGSVWAGSGINGLGQGVYKFDGLSWTIFDKETYSGIPNNDFYNVFPASDKTVYFLNWGTGITAYKDGNFTNYNTSNTNMVGISKDPNFLVISSAAQDSKGNVWFLNYSSANSRPLSVLTTDGTWYYNFPLVNPAVTSSESVEHLVIDQYDTKWFAATVGKRGVYYYNDNGTLNNTSDDTYGYISESDGLATDIINALVVDKRGNLWIGTSSGVTLITNTQNPKASITNIYGRAVREQNINCIAVDPLDQKWIGTTAGVFELSSDGTQLLAQYNTDNSPLPSNDIKCITFDPEKGIAYFGTDFGLTSLTTTSIQPYESFSDIFVYPNPYIIDGNQGTLKIDGLIKDTQIKILSITGKLITEFSSPGGRLAFWDGKDSFGKLVSSGVYIIAAYDEEANNVATSKVAVIRK